MGRHARRNCNLQSFHYSRRSSRERDGVSKDSRCPQRQKVNLAFVAAFLFVSQLVSAADWPHWRGPNRNDQSADASGWTGSQWPATSSEKLWSKNVGIGCTSPIIVKDKMYVMGWRSNKEYLYCLDVATGKENWAASYPCAKYGRRATGDQSIYAGVSSTPEFDPKTGMIYTLSIDGHLGCWDTKKDGQFVWGFNLYDKYDVKQRPDVGRRKKTLRDYGYTSSPLVQNDALIVEVGDETANLIAYDKRTGRELWKSQCKDEAAHTGGAVPITVEGVRCVVVLTLRNLVVTRIDKGHEGETVATYPWTTDFANNIPTPAVHEDSVIVTSAYNQYAMCKLKITLSGAIKVWENNELASGVCSAIVHKGHVYWAWRGVHCVDFATGKEKWTGGSVGTQGSCILTADDRLIVWSNRGDLQLVDTAERSPDKFKVLAEKKRMFSRDVWPHVVMADERLFCKDRDGNLICLPLSSEAAKLVTKPTPPPRPAPKSIDLKTWPGSDESVIFAWDRSLGDKKVLGAAKQAKLQLRDSAKITSNGLEVTKGAVLVEGANDSLLAACKKSNELTIETVFISSRARQTGPARMISFSSDGYNRNFSLAQEGDQLLLRLRTPQTGDNGLRPETKLFRIAPNKRHHILVTYRDGQLVCYLDGKKVNESSQVTGDFSNWSNHHFLIGDEWDGGGTRDWTGTIERVCILNRFVGDQEAKRRHSLGR